MKGFKKNKSIILGTIFFCASLIIYVMLSAQSEIYEEKKGENSIPKIPIRLIGPTEQKVEISVLGKVEAQQKFDVFTEVNGLLEKGDHPLLSATLFKKGDVIAHINSNQFRAELIATQSAFKARIAACMAVVKFDFPKNYENWVSYLSAIAPDENLKALPKYLSQKEAMYFTSKGIEEQYYHIKSQEELLKKYSIIAPFDGMLTSVAMKQGALVSPGQRLATFIGKHNFDIITDIKKEQINWVQVNDTLLLENGKSAIVKRIGNTIDTQSQTIKVYASIVDNTLKHDDYISGQLKTSTKVQGCMIDRKLISGNNTILISENGLVQQIPVCPLLSNRGKSLITGVYKPVFLLTKTSGLKPGQTIQAIQMQ